MNKAELLTLLEQFPDDMEVKIVCDRFVRPVEKVSTVVDVDTNIVSIEIVAEDRKPMTVDDLRAIREQMRQSQERFRQNGHLYFTEAKLHNSSEIVLSQERLDEIKQQMKLFFDRGDPNT